mmetsp:Transcript_23981/g.75679  ORF Transcript_23981/g.75679 Transcript_23981/m.75679 type:complete len:299 (+) Transcript_23981:553-1449(+)
MLLGDAVADVPCAERVEREHQLRDVVEARHGASYGVDGLGKELSQPWRVIDIALISIFVGCPVAVLVADLGREEVDDLRLQLEGVAVQELGDVVAARRLHLLPAALHGGLRLAARHVVGVVAREAVGLDVLRPPGSGGLEDRGRLGRRRLLQEAPARLFGRSALLQPPLQLHRVAAREAQVLQVAVLDVHQHVHVVEAVLHQDSRVLLEPDSVHEGSHWIILQGLATRHAALSLELLQLPPQLYKVARGDPEIPQVCVLNLQQRLHLVEAVRDQLAGVLRHAELAEEDRDLVLRGCWS